MSKIFSPNIYDKSTPLLTILDCTYFLFILVLVLEDNAQLRDRLSEKSLPRKEYFQFRTEGGQRKYVDSLFLMFNADDIVVMILTKFATP